MHADVPFFRSSRLVEPASSLAILGKQSRSKAFGCRESCLEILGSSVGNYSGKSEKTVVSGPVFTLFAQQYSTPVPNVYLTNLLPSIQL